MQRTNIFIASSSEMHHERLELVDIFTDMCSETMEYIPVKWEYMDSSVHKEHKQSEYMRRLQKCEICIVMFWRSLGEYTEKELRLALEEQSQGNNLQKTFILFKEDGESVSPELKELKNKCIQQYREIVHTFSDSQELRELAKQLIHSANVKCNESTWDGKEVKVMIAADEELNEEKLEFTELMAHLNEVLENRGIRLRRVKWTPHGADDFRKELSNCEMCLNLYWTKLPQQADEEMKTAYDLSTNGSNPQHLYIFFKEKNSDKISAALADFKTKVETVYGHFFCKFENVDTMNLHFILQLETSNSLLSESVVKVANGRVFIEGLSFVDLDNVPFSGLNKEYRRLQVRISELESFLKEVSGQYKVNPNDDNLLEKLIAIKLSLKEAYEDYNRYQEFLIDKAREFVCSSNEQVTNKMLRARMLFEKGMASEAAKIMNIEDLKREKRKRDNLWDVQIANRILEINEFIDAATYALTNPEGTMQERFLTACDAYREAIDIARKIHYDNKKMVKMLFDYANLLRAFYYINDAIDCYKEVLNICRQIGDEHYLLASLLNLGCSQSDLRHDEEAEETFVEALQLVRRMAKYNQEKDYLPTIASTLNSLANICSKTNNYDMAKRYYLDSLKTLRCTNNTNASVLCIKILTLNNLGNLQVEKGQHEDARKCYVDALNLLSKINPNSNPELVAMTLKNLANLQRKEERYEEAERNYSNALSIYKRLCETNPSLIDYLGETYKDYALLYMYKMTPITHFTEEDFDSIIDMIKLFREALIIFKQLEEKTSGLYSVNIKTIESFLENDIVKQINQEFIECNNDKEND